MGQGEARDRCGPQQQRQAGQGGGAPLGRQRVEHGAGLAMRRVQRRDAAAGQVNAQAQGGRHAAAACRCCARHSCVKRAK